MFRSLQTLLRWNWNSRTSYAHDLTESDLNTLQTLRKSRGWQAFAQILDGQIEKIAEELLTAQTTELMWNARGKIAGLRESILMVEAIITQTEQQDARERLATAAADERSSRRDRLLQPTPFAKR